jgi:DNA-binding beta-propeller fold protein YncE
VAAIASPAHGAASSCCGPFNEPGQIAVAPGGEHVYVSDPYVTLALRLDPATGTLSQIDSYDGGGALMTMSPDGRFLYQAPSYPPQHRAINVWSRDPATGALSIVGSWKAASFGQWEEIEISPDGGQLYVTDSQRDALTIVTTIPEALDLLAEAGLPQVGIMVDLWHLWDTPEIERHLRESVARFTGVHVSDWFADGRLDRALPGEGVSRTMELVGVLADAGWRGSLDVEIFGDATRPDSLWSLPVEEAARLAYAALTRVVP